MHRTYLLFTLFSLVFSMGASAQQPTDPFPEVDTSTLPYTMNVTGYVRLNGRKLTKDDGLIVAAYQGDQIRGKTTPFDPSPAYPDLIMLDVYGDTNGQPITFHVSVSSGVFIARQSITFQNNAVIGTLKQPYYIDIIPATIIGDVNRDGQVTIADVIALVNIILGNDATEPYRYDHLAADVNADNSITIADVTALVNIVLGR